MITTLHAAQDLCLDQFLLGMIEITGLLQGLQGVLGLSPALFLHRIRKIIGQAAVPQGLGKMEKMVRLLVMHQASPRVQEGTSGVHPGLILDPTVLAKG